MNIHISVQTSYVFNRMENPKQEHMQIKKQRQRSSTAAFREQETPMRSLTHARLQFGSMVPHWVRAIGFQPVSRASLMDMYIVILIASLERGRVSN